ncbi:MAG: DNA polymerase III subunit chi [Rhodospirillaceae bacterium]|nr:DNA polymerase III subunit chi [Rhodospirillaceae bacterium]|tara:strand:+ start:5407 stop:5862 length:456 start_codon:yes stop_codon:yes gene_type:complete
MTEIGFYHLTRTPLEHALLKLLEKATAAGKRVVVRTSSDERLSFLNGALWTVDAASFLPHGSEKEGNPSQQPVWLTTDTNNPNDAEVLILTDSAESTSYETYERCLEIFDGNNEVAVTAARERWKNYSAVDCNLTYWQQTESGGWKKKTEQ